MNDPIIFLDFDGVIRVSDAGTGLSPDPADFCHVRMLLLASICMQTRAKIVVSSDWRNLDNRHQIESHLSPWLASYLHDDWATPICGHRWNEVERWLAHHPEVTRYAILEDFAPHFKDCPPAMASRLVLCNNRHGLVEAMIPRLHRALI